MNNQKTLFAGAILSGLGVALGAFGAHALKATLTLNGRLETYELAVRYELYHGLSLLIIGVVQQYFTHSFIRLSSVAILTGTILFSGSLFLFSLTNETTYAMITPFGGLFLLAGWSLLALGILKSKSIK